MRWNCGYGDATRAPQRQGSFAINAWKGGLDRTFLQVGGKVPAMQTFLIMLLIWITPSFHSLPGKQQRGQGFCGFIRSIAPRKSLIDRHPTQW